MKYFKQIIGVLLAVLLMSAAVMAEDVKPLVVRNQGRVEVQKAQNDEWRLVSSSRLMSVGGAGRTQEQSVASVHLWNDKVKVTMFEKCTFRYQDLVKKGSKYVAAFNQDKGLIKVKVDPVISRTSGFQVKTPQAILAVQGTEFFVRVGTGDPSLKNPPPLNMDYLKDNKEFEVPKSAFIPLAPVLSIGGGAPVMLAQVNTGNVGFTLLGVMKGEVLINPDDKSPQPVKAGQTVVIWENDKPLFLKMDPEFVKERAPEPVTADVPNMPEVTSQPTSTDPSAAPINPSAYPSHASPHSSSSSMPYIYNPGSPPMP